MQSTQNYIWIRKSSAWFHRNMASSSWPVCRSQEQKVAEVLYQRSRSLKVDAFWHRWPQGLLYAFTPFPFLGKVIQKIRQEEAKVIVRLHTGWVECFRYGRLGLESCIVCTSETRYPSPRSSPQSRPRPSTTDSLAIDREVLNTLSSIVIGTLISSKLALMLNAYSSIWTRT